VINLVKVPTLEAEQTACHPERSGDRFELVLRLVVGYPGGIFSQGRELHPGTAGHMEGGATSKLSDTAPVGLELKKANSA